MTRLAAVLLALALAACGGKAGARRPAISAPPAAPPSVVSICHVVEEECTWLEQDLRALSPEQAAEHSDHPHDYGGECDPAKPPPFRKVCRGEPAEEEPAPEPPPQPRPRVVEVCHVERQTATTCHAYTFRLPPERADRHVEGHGAAGDHLGACRGDECKRQETDPR